MKYIQQLDMSDCGAACLAMNADELFFINGGSGSGYNCYMGGVL